MTDAFDRPCPNTPPAAIDDRRPDIQVVQEVDGSRTDAGSNYGDFHAQAQMQAMAGNQVDDHYREAGGLSAQAAVSPNERHTLASDDMPPGSRNDAADTWLPDVVADPGVATNPAGGDAAGSNAMIPVEHHPLGRRTEQTGAARPGRQSGSAGGLAPDSGASADRE